MIAAAVVIDGKYASLMNLANMKNVENYYLISQPYMKNRLGHQMVASSHIMAEQ